MSYKGGFPTRDGFGTGAANERQMLDKVDPNGIRTVFREDFQGGVTVLRTRLGHPHFFNVETPALYSEATVCTGPYGFVDTTYNYNGIGDSTSGVLQQLIDENGSAQSDTKLRDSHGWKAAFHNALPSNFSGLMRKLLQVEHAVIQEWSRHDFSCTYIKSHGLFLNPMTGQRWLIEINPSGVYRIPLTFCETPESWSAYLAYEAAAFSGNPYADAVDMVSPYWAVTEYDATNAVKIADPPSCYADGYTVFYDWCGWAFNYDGTKATIVCVRPYPPQMSWYQTALFDITIGGSGTEGAPTYVTITKTDEAILASSINDVDDNHNAFIQVPKDYPGVCETLSLFSTISVGSLIDAPLFSFYEESGVKQVYRFQTYAATSGVQNSGDNGGPTGVTVVRTGTWTYNILGGDTEYPTPDSQAAPLSYGVAVETQTSGERSRTETGDFGGWGGISGADFPSQDVDRVVTAQYTEAFLKESGWGRSAPLGVEGLRLTHSSRLEYTYEGLSHKICDTVPYEYQDNAQLRCRVTARVLATSGTHDRVVSHMSTLILHGYDRESVAFASSVVDYQQGHSLTGTWGAHKAVQMNGGYLYSRTATGSSFGTDCGPAEPGTRDPCIWADPDGPGPFPVQTSEIQGFYSFGALDGYVVGAEAIFEDIDCAVAVSVSDVSESRPDTTLSSNTMYVRVRGQTKTFGFTDEDVHKVYKGGDVFRFWAGAAAWNSRLFYSKEINQKPQVEGVGGYTIGQRSLFGFLGVF